MEEKNNIPHSKVKRAARFVKTGAKVGKNYLSHYTRKALQQEVDKEELDKANAGEIFSALGELKGSALKVAQMLSMERNLLPDAYADMLALSHHNAPPLSGPLIVKTFRQYTGKSPHEVFDEFDMTAVNAASIGQVHKAVKDGRQLAVKIQYPGVADSIKSDLNMIKPVVLVATGLPEKDLSEFLEEVEGKLREETDYEHELQNSMQLRKLCSRLPNIVFPEYFPQWSGRRVLTMSWLEGITLGEFVAGNPPQELRNKVGQTLWDFYNFQVNELLLTQADPHPGNFIIFGDGRVGALDFGCVKSIPREFYDNYYSLTLPEVHNNEAELLKRFEALDFLRPWDTPKQREMLVDLLKKGMELILPPFLNETFDFSDPAYFDEMYAFGFQEKMKRMSELRKLDKPHAQKHILYVNRTFMGLFRLLHELKATVITRPSPPLLPEA